MLRKIFSNIRFSSVYRTAAQEITDQPEFLNAAAAFETTLSPKKVAEELKTIETTLHKNPPIRFGPRTIDLDILLYGKTNAADPTLTIPHPKLHVRRFVLEPLIDLGAGETVHPLLDKALKVLLSEVQSQHCEKITLQL